MCVAKGVNPSFRLHMHYKCYVAGQLIWEPHYRGFCFTLHVTVCLTLIDESNILPLKVPDTHTWLQYRAPDTQSILWGTPWSLSELVQNDSVSTIEFKFRSSLSHFQFVQDFWLGMTWHILRSFSWIIVVPFEGLSKILIGKWSVILDRKVDHRPLSCRDQDSRSQTVWERARGVSSFAWLHSHVIFIEWLQTCLC